MFSKQDTTFQKIHSLLLVFTLCTWIKTCGRIPRISDQKDIWTSKEDSQSRKTLHFLLELAAVFALVKLSLETQCSSALLRCYKISTLSQWKSPEEVLMITHVDWRWFQTTFGSNWKQDKKMNKFEINSQAAWIEGLTPHKLRGTK